MSSNLDNLFSFLLTEDSSSAQKTIQKALYDWIEEGKRANPGPHYFPPKELFRYREYMRPTRPDLLKSIEKEGIKEPLTLLFGSDGTIKIGEGNHRLKAAIQLGLEEVPVVFHFVSSAEKDPIQRDRAQMKKDVELARKRSQEKEREAFRKKHGLDRTEEEERRRRERRWQQMSPEERKQAEEEKEKRIKNIMDILGV